MYARDAVNIAFEALVLGITLFKTLDLKRTAATLGIRTSLNDLLVHDGMLSNASDAVNINCILR